MAHKKTPQIFKKFQKSNILVIIINVNGLNSPVKKTNMYSQNFNFLKSSFHLKGKQNINQLNIIKSKRV